MGDIFSKSDSRYSMVIAIDFGTSYSGYAFSYRKAKEIKDIVMNDNWGAEMASQFYKTPTSVKYDNSTGAFNSFGFEAEKKYFEQLEKSKCEKDTPTLFRAFKMQLFNKQKVNISKYMFLNYIKSGNEIIKHYSIKRAFCICWYNNNAVGWALLSFEAQLFLFEALHLFISTLCSN